MAVFTTFSSALWLAVLRPVRVRRVRPAVDLGRQASRDLGHRWRPRVVLVLRITVGLSPAVVPARLGPRLGVDADGDGARRHATLPSRACSSRRSCCTTRRSRPVGAVVSLVCLVVTVRAPVTTHDRVVRRIIVEMTGTILFSPILDVMAGGCSSSAARIELPAVPVLLSSDPPVRLAGRTRSAGIFSSRITSKLQIGVITPKAAPSRRPSSTSRSIRRAVGRRLHVDRGDRVGAGRAPNLTGMPSAGWPMLSIAAQRVPRHHRLRSPAATTWRSSRTGSDWIRTTRACPIITSVMDLAGVACILLVMTSLGVLGHG